MLATILRRSLAFAAPFALAAPALAGTELVGLYRNGGLMTIDSGTAAVVPLGGISGLPGLAEVGSLELGPDGSYYTLTTGIWPQLYRVDPDTWAATLVGTLAVDLVTEGGLAIAPNGAAWFANVGTSPPPLYTVDLNTGVVGLVGFMGNGSLDLNGLAWRSDGMLVGLDAVTNALITIDPQTAQIAPLGNAPGVIGSTGGMTILDGVGYYCTAGAGATTPGSNRLFQFDPFTGATTNLGTFSGMQVLAGFVALASGEAPIGTAYCSGDGSGALCPCGNVGGFSLGCANSAGTGAVLAGSGSASVGLDDLGLEAFGLPPQRPALLFVGTQQVNGGAGALFGDGLRCVGGPIQRLGVQIGDANGAASWGPGLAAAGGWNAGDLRRFQVWYRDPAGPCSTGFNLSQGLELVFAP